MAMPDERAPELPFDRVLVVSTAKMMRAQDFLKLPLAQRVRLILAKDVEFFRGAQRILTQDALEVLRDSKG